MLRQDAHQKHSFAHIGQVVFSTWGVLGLGFGIWGLGLRAFGAVFGVEGVGFGIQGLVLRASDLLQVLWFFGIHFELGILKDLVLRVLGHLLLKILPYCPTTQCPF